MNNKNTTRHENNMFPVIKIGYDNKIQYHNIAAMPLLGSWNCKMNERISIALQRQHPELFDLTRSQSRDVAIRYLEYTFRFSVIPYPEAGFIGIYGYQIEIAEQTAANSRMSVEQAVN